MLRIWNVYWWSQEEGDFRVGVVYAADEEDAREAWRSYLHGFRMTRPAAPGQPQHAFVDWIYPEWDAALKEGRVSMSSPVGESWRGADFVEG
jgi:hypothetical protein